MKKQFTLLQLFSLVDGRLSTKMDDVYEMLNHICDESLMTHHLPTALAYIKEKNPAWFNEVQEMLVVIAEKAPMEEVNHEQFEWMIRYINSHPKTYNVPQLKDECDTSDFGNYMVENSLLLKIGTGL